MINMIEDKFKNFCEIFFDEVDNISEYRWKYLIELFENKNLNTDKIIITSTPMGDSKIFDYLKYNKMRFKYE